MANFHGRHDLGSRETTTTGGTQHASNTFSTKRRSRGLRKISTLDNISSINCAEASAAVLSEILISSTPRWPFKACCIRLVFPLPLGPYTNTVSLLVDLRAVNNSSCFMGRVTNLPSRTSTPSIRFLARRKAASCINVHRRPNKTKKTSASADEIRLNQKQKCSAASFSSGVSFVMAQIQ